MLAGKPLDPQSAAARQYARRASEAHARAASSADQSAVLPGEGKTAGTVAHTAFSAGMAVPAPLSGCDATAPAVVPKPKAAKAAKPKPQPKPRKQKRRAADGDGRRKKRR